MKNVYIILITLLIPVKYFAQFEAQEEYVRSILELVKEGDHTNNYNQSKLKQEIWDIEKLEGKYTSMLTFSFNEYKIVKSSIDQVIVNFKDHDQDYQVPTKWSTQRLFNLVEIENGYKLKHFMPQGGMNTYLYFYTTKELNPPTDKHTDFSDDFFKLELKGPNPYKAVEGEFSSLLSEDLSPIFMTKPQNIEGAINGYKRLQMHYSSITKKDRNSYLIKGKSKVGNNVCSFSGTVEVIKVLKYKTLPRCGSGYDDTSCEGGVILSKVILEEDSCEFGQGKFEGILCSYWYWDKQERVVKIFDRDDASDSYRNNTFVGIWKSPKTGFQQKAIWGIRELPYTEDLDTAAGGTIINRKYYSNGWNVDVENWWK